MQLQEPAIPTRRPGDGRFELRKRQYVKLRMPVGAAALGGGVEQEPQRVHLDRAAWVLAGVGHVAGDLVAPEVADRRRLDG